MPVSSHVQAVIDDADKPENRLILNELLLFAIKHKVSEISIEKNTGKITLQMPTEGEENQALSPVLRGVAARVRIMSKLDIFQTAPQKGTLELDVEQIGKIPIVVDVSPVNGSEEIKLTIPS